MKQIGANSKKLERQTNKNFLYGVENICPVWEGERTEKRFGPREFNTA